MAPHRPPRVVYVTRPAFLDHSLPLVRALAPHATVHLMLELSPEERSAGVFGEERIVARAGIRSARGALQAGYLAAARQFINGLASFDVIAHTSRRAFAPRSLGVTAAAALRMHSLQPDVVHFEDLSVRSSPLLFALPGVPKLVAIHDARTHLGERATRAEVVRRLAVRRAQRLLFYSCFSRAQFGTGQAGAVLPLGPKQVWSELPGPELAERPHSVLFFGRLSAYKGLDVLYAALPAIAGQVRDLRVVVAGRPGGGFTPPRPPKLPDGAELVTYFERIDPPMVRCLFQEASVVVLPYVEASQSGVAQTAFAFGKPVVASAVGGLPEDVADGETGLLVPPGDPERLAQSVARLLLDPPLRARMGQTISARAQAAWPEIGARLAALYAGMLVST